MPIIRNYDVLSMLLTGVNQYLHGSGNFLSVAENTELAVGRKVDF